jgi:hypothetical protein
MFLSGQRGTRHSDLGERSDGGAQRALALHLDVVEGGHALIHGNLDQQHPRSLGDPSEVQAIDAERREPFLDGATRKQARSRMLQCIQYSISVYTSAPIMYSCVKIMFIPQHRWQFSHSGGMAGTRSCRPKHSKLLEKLPRFVLYPVIVRPRIRCLGLVSAIK